MTHVKRQLDSRSLRFRNMLAKIGEQEERAGPSSRRIQLSNEDFKEDDGCVLLEQTNQLIVGTLTCIDSS